MLKYACVNCVRFVLINLQHCGQPWRWLVAAYRPVVMFGCIIAGCLCSIVSVLSCVAACISCGLSADKINEELLLLLLLLLDGYQIGSVDYVLDVYSCAKLHYDPIREFCPPPHMRSCLSNIHSASFLGSSNSLPPRPLRRFWRLICQKNVVSHKDVPFGSPENEILHFGPFHQNGNFGRFSTGVRKFRLKTGFNMGASSVNSNTHKTISYAFRNWMINTQIDSLQIKIFG